MDRETSTEEYQRLAEKPEEIRAWDNEMLLRHFLNTRFIIMTEVPNAANGVRMGCVIRVGRTEYEEVLKRMVEGTR